LNVQVERSPTASTQMTMYHCHFVMMSGKYNEVKSL